MSLLYRRVLALYSLCALLFLAVLVLGDGQDIGQIFVKPLDDSLSILGNGRTPTASLETTKVYTFLPYWNVDDRDYNTNNVTDISYFGLNVDAKGRIVTNDGNYQRWRNNKDLSKLLANMKKAGKNLSFTLICHVDTDLDAVLSCESCWPSLAKDVEKELKWAGIRDINVDFEYAGYTTPENAQSYSKLVGYLNSYLDTALGKSFVVVSTYADAVEKSERSDVRLTDPKTLAQNADALFVMAYDFHGPTSANAGPVSPLEGAYSTTKLNLTTMLKSYLDVVPASKLILGLPFYGYDWVVEDTLPMSTRIEGNDYIGYSKVRTYAEVTNLLIDKRLTPKWDDVAKTPYVNYVDEETGSLRQIYYDNKESLGYKIALAWKDQLLGVGSWALGYEGGYADLWGAFKPQL